MTVFALLHAGLQIGLDQWTIHWSTVIGLAAIGALGGVLVGGVLVGRAFVERLDLSALYDAIKDEDAAPPPAPSPAPAASPEGPSTRRTEPSRRSTKPRTTMAKQPRSGLSARRRARTLWLPVAPRNCRQPST